MPNFYDAFRRNDESYYIQDENNIYSSTEYNPYEVNPNVRNVQSEITGNPLLGKLNREGALQFYQRLYRNPSSALYRKFRNNLRKSIGGAINPNSLLALTLATGGSPTQAKERIQAAEGRISDAVVTGTDQYYTSAQNTANQLLSEEIDLYKFEEQMKAQRRAEERGIFGDILGGLGTIAGFALAPATGGASLAAAPFLPSMYQNFQYPDTSRSFQRLGNPNQGFFGYNSGG